VTIVVLLRVLGGAGLLGLALVLVAGAAVVGVGLGLAERLRWI